MMSTLASFKGRGSATPRPEIVSAPSWSSLANSLSSCLRFFSASSLAKMKKLYSEALSQDSGATLDDLREAVTTLDVAGRTARRVLGRAHPLTAAIEGQQRNARAVLHAREAGKRVVFSNTK